jgi:methylmalonyl-CoA mutase cobalamin-binding domain/chain
MGRREPNPGPAHPLPSFEVNAKRKLELPKRVPIRLLAAVPICDGHDSAIHTVNQEFVRNGMEVVYLGYHRSARDLVRSAIQEDVRAIGISTYNGGHLEFFKEVIDLLKKEGADDIGIFGGGGGTVTPADARYLEKHGVDLIFGAGVPLSEMVKFVKSAYGPPAAAPWRRGSTLKRGHRTKLLGVHASGCPTDRQLGRLLSAVETRSLGHRREGGRLETPCRVVGITGPGGSGKTTLIDELALRFLNQNAGGRMAILSHDPSMSGRGALLGDRAMMLYAQHDRVFMRSLGTRGRSGGIGAATRRCLEILRNCGFELVLVETVGIGQEALPFGGNLVDCSVLVMSPSYGSRLQLQKIAMLRQADIVVLNKADLPQAETARAELELLVQSNGGGQRFVATSAKSHRDGGVDELFRWVFP